MKVSVRVGEIDPATERNEVGARQVALTRKCPSWRHDGDRAVLSEKATHTKRHSRAVGFPSECEMKKSLSEEAMSL